MSEEKIVIEQVEEEQFVGTILEIPNYIEEVSSEL
jgi:hypothetical protein